MAQRLLLPLKTLHTGKHTPAPKQHDPQWKLTRSMLGSISRKGFPGSRPSFPAEEMWLKAPTGYLWLISCPAEVMLLSYRAGPSPTFSKQAYLSKAVRRLQKDASKWVHELFRHGRVILMTVIRKRCSDQCCCLYHCQLSCACKSI